MDAMPSECTIRIARSLAHSLRSHIEQQKGRGQGLIYQTKSKKKKSETKESIAHLCKVGAG